MTTMTKYQSIVWLDAFTSWPWCSRPLTSFRLSLYSNRKSRSTPGRKTVECTTSGSTQLLNGSLKCQSCFSFQYSLMFAFTSPSDSQTVFMSSSSSTSLWRWWFRHLQQRDTYSPPYSARRQRQWLVSLSSISPWLSRLAIWLIWKASSIRLPRSFLHGSCTSHRCIMPSQRWWWRSTQLKVIHSQTRCSYSTASMANTTGVAWQCWLFLPYFNVS